MNKLIIVCLLFAVLGCTYADVAADCICPMIYDPVCSASGKTFPNQCTMNCYVGEVLATRGACVTRK
ncbi:Hypothetical predicted protein [Mytilus galloprovincialis]|uniref:Kazal-like domain-containing protein n=1 Tax=Mytilus galloprovincialis TaxID=29158 RepID=A0A8B6EW23_MYTGA|nr:Hypothetical predicted protein [Mytilus galloprovincialis]